MFTAIETCHKNCHPVIEKTLSACPVRVRIQKGPTCSAFRQESFDAFDNCVDLFCAIALDKPEMSFLKRRQGCIERLRFRHQAICAFHLIISSTLARGSRALDNSSHSFLSIKSVW